MLHDNDKGMRAVADEHLDGLDTPLRRDEDLYQEVVDSEPVPVTEPEKKQFFAKYGIHICVGVIALALMSGLGWFAVRILSPAPAVAQRLSPPETFGTQASKSNSGVAEPMQFGGEPVDQRRQGITSAPALDDEPGSVLPITPRTEQEQDEQFYDTLVSAAEHNAPTPKTLNEASHTQTVTAVQVAPETADKFAAISVAIANQSKEIGRASV